MTTGEEVDVLHAKELCGTCSLPRDAHWGAHCLASGRCTGFIASGQWPRGITRPSPHKFIGQSDRELVCAICGSYENGPIHNAAPVPSEQVETVTTEECPNCGADLAPDEPCVECEETNDREQEELDSYEYRNEQEAERRDLYKEETAPSEQEVTPERVVTSYCGKCGVMVNYQQNYCDACTPKLPRWMQGEKWSFVRYSNNPDDKRWCIQPTTSLRPLFFADVPDATTVKQSHDIGRYVAEAVNSHAELKERVRELEVIAEDTVKFLNLFFQFNEDPWADWNGLRSRARAALSKGEK